MIMCYIWVHDLLNVVTEALHKAVRWELTILITTSFLHTTSTLKQFSHNGIAFLKTVWICICFPFSCVEESRPVITYFTVRLKMKTFICIHLKRISKQLVETLKLAHMSSVPKPLVRCLVVYCLHSQLSS